MSEHVVLFVGAMGAGKTTAIRSLSEIPVVSTEAENSDRAIIDKQTTTVALDYGQITLGDDDMVRLYGVPGQTRFDFMWAILRERARGMVLLVAADAADVVAEALAFLDAFRELAERGAVVVGITRADVAQAAPGEDAVTRVSEALAREHPELVAPVMAVDPRDEADVRVALLSLVASLEMRAMWGAAS